MIIILNAENAFKQTYHDQKGEGVKEDDNKDPDTHSEDKEIDKS